MMPAIGTPVAANTSLGASLTLPCLCLSTFWRLNIHYVLVNAKCGTARLQKYSDQLPVTAMTTEQCQFHCKYQVVLTMK